jgi:hypothetical protein
MRDESFDSFEWLFKTCKACMGGREPHVLLIGKCCLFVQFTHDYLGLCNTM